MKPARTVGCMKMSESVHTTNGGTSSKNEAA